MTKAIKTAFALCVVAGFAAAGLFGTEYILDRSGTAEASDRGNAPRATRVGVATPESSTVDDTVSAVGTVMPVRDVNLRPTVSGRVTDVAVTSGQEVAAGDLILQLDDRAQRAQIAGAEATLTEARQNLNRIEELAESNTAAEQRLEAARAAFNRAESEMLAARAALDDRRIEAPFAGKLGLIDVDPGAYISPQNVIAPLSDLSVVHVDIALPERYFDRVTRGKAVELTLPAYPDRTFEGVVTVRAAAVDASSRSFDVRAEVDNSEGRLVGGMFARTRLVLDTGEGLAIDDDAIISEGSATYVFVVEDGQASRRDVTAGQSLGALTEITEGLQPDDRVVVSGWNALRDGAPVTVAEEIAREALQ